MKHLVTLTLVIVVGLASGTALAAGNTEQGLKADGLRLQALADRYGQLQGLKADALRWQAMADFYGSRAALAAGTTEQGLRADGLRLQAMAERYGQLQGLKADALRWQAMADFYNSRDVASVSSSNGSTFDWGDAGLGAAGGLGIAALAAAVVFVRQSRRTKLAL